MERKSLFIFSRETLIPAQYFKLWLIEYQTMNKECWPLISSWYSRCRDAVLQHQKDLFPGIVNPVQIAQQWRMLLLSRLCLFSGRAESSHLATGRSTGTEAGIPPYTGLSWRATWTSERSSLEWLFHGPTSLFIKLCSFYFLPRFSKAQVGFTLNNQGEPTIPVPLSISFWAQGL